MKKFKSLAALMLALVMVLSLAACGGTKAPVDEGGQQQGGDAKLEEVMGITIPEFSVLVNGVAVTHEMMADYAVYKVVATSVNSSGTESTVTYCGFSMADVLTATGLKGEATKLTAVATDGYEVEYDAALLKEANTLLALTKDGEPFSKAPWFAPCSSETTGDYMKLLSELKIEGMDVKEGGEKQPAGEGEEIDLDALPEISDRTDKVVFADFCFKVNGKEVKNADLEGLSIYKIERSMLNKKGNIKTSTYTGYKLADVLNKLGITGYTSVIAVANDGFEVTLSAEAANSDYTLLAIEVDKEVGEDGTIWVAQCESSSSSDYAKLIVEIKAQ